MLFKLLGLLIIGGGLIAGLTLISQPQLLQEKAADVGYGNTPSPRATLLASPGVRSPTPKATLKPGYVNCGGQICHSSSCHCLDGAPCTRLGCRRDIRSSCIAQGRSWCVNELGIGGYSCCQSGFVCNPSGIGCVKAR